MNYCMTYGTVIGTTFVDVTQVSIPSKKDSRIRTYIEHLILIYEGECLDSFSLNNNSINFKIIFSDDQKRNSFIKDANETIDSGKLVTIDINENSNLANLIIKFDDLMESISPFLDFVKNNGGIDKNSNSFPGIKEFEKARLNGLLPANVQDSKYSFEVFMEDYLMGKITLEKSK